MYFISGICCCISSLLLFFEKKDKFIYDDDDAHNPNKETPTIDEKNNQNELHPIIAEQDK